MARRLKELSLRYDRVLFIGGMAHVDSVLKLLDQPSFPDFHHADREVVEICTLTAESCRDVLAEWGYLSSHYEKAREQIVSKRPSRQAEDHLSTCTAKLPKIIIKIPEMNSPAITCAIS